MLRSTSNALAAVRIDQRAAGVLRDRVDRQVAAHEVVLQRDVGRGVDLEAVIARPGLALRAGQRVFLVRVRVQEDRKILAHRQVAGLQHVARTGAGDDPVAIVDRLAQQLVAHRSADHVRLHGMSGGGGCSASRGPICGPRRGRSCGPLLPSSAA
jgi:hypothetical protein